MRSSAKTNEIEELKKQVEKLKEDKKALKKENKSLAGMLARSRAKSEKYHDALKKKVPKDTLDQETFKLLMSLLDDISTPA